MDVSVPVGFRQRPGWFVVVAILLIGQAWLTLRLFTSDLSLDRLLDDEPIVSGRHALHFYHGLIGAKASKERGTSCCFDPAYQAGYPKTPVFDGGSRPAEFFQMVGGPRPASYKIGLAICCLLVPLAFTVMGRGIGLSPDASCVSGLLGSVVWWSSPCQALLAAGDLDLLLGGLCALLHITWLIRFERAPGFDSWIMMTLFATLAWYAQPILVVGYLPLILLYYLWVASRQGAIWHLACGAAAVFAFGLNASWLMDWSQYLWLYLPFGGNLPPAAPFWPTVTRQWSNLIPADPVTLGIAAIGLIGLLVMLRTNRAAAWLLGLGTLEYVLAAWSGKFWPVLTDFGTEKLLLIGAWCLVLPAAHVLSRIAGHLGNASGWRPVGAVWLLVGLAGLAWSIDLPRQFTSRPRLNSGFNPERTEIVHTLIAQTSPDARILWEDRTGEESGWTALLAAMTERPFLGGLDPEGRLEHMYARLCDGKLGGKAVREWDEVQLRQFIERYNIGWVVAWTPESIERFRKLPFAKPMNLRNGGAGVLFKLDRKPSYFLKGHGQWVQADSQRIALAEVVPENGEIVLSMHYQTNMRVSPSYVQIERDLDLDDPIPMIRLRVPGPVARVMIVWDNP